MQLTKEEACFMARVLNKNAKREKIAVFRENGTYTLKAVDALLLGGGAQDGHIGRGSKLEIYDEVLRYIFALGKTQGETARAFGISKSAVYNWVSDYRKTGRMAADLRRELKENSSWDEYKDLVEIILKEKSKGNRKSDILRKYGLEEKLYVTVQTKLTRGIYKDIDEYIALQDKYGG